MDIEPNPLTKEPGEITPPIHELTFQDIQLIALRKLGLRHLTDRQSAERELRDGIEMGDALALASPTNLLDEVQTNFGPIKPRLNNLALNQQTELIEKYNEALRSFFVDSVGRDINIVASDEATIEAAGRKTARESAVFIVAEFDGSEHGYDTGNYYGLGKCGKRTIPPEKVFTGIRLDEAELSPLIKDFPDQQMEQDTFYSLRDTLGTALFTKFTGYIKSLQPSAQSTNSGTI